MNFKKYNKEEHITIISLIVSVILLIIMGITVYKDLHNCTCYVIDRTDNQEAICNVCHKPF